jgi:hypothetical protein
MDTAGYAMWLNMNAGSIIACDNSTDCGSTEDGADMFCAIVNVGGIGGAMSPG